MRLESGMLDLGCYGILGISGLGSGAGRGFYNRASGVPGAEFPKWVLTPRVQTLNPKLQNPCCIVTLPRTHNGSAFFLKSQGEITAQS